MSFKSLSALVVLGSFALPSNAHAGEGLMEEMMNAIIDLFTIEQGVCGVNMSCPERNLFDDLLDAKPIEGGVCGFDMSCPTGPDYVDPEDGYPA